MLQKLLLELALQCLAFFSQFCCVSVFLSSALDINLKYLNVSFTLELLGNSLFLTQPASNAMIGSKTSGGLLAINRNKKHAVKISGSLSNFSLAISFMACFLWLFGSTIN